MGLKLSETRVKKLTSALISLEIGQYQPRKISFEKLIILNQWYIKVYTITCKQTFQSHEALNSSIESLNEWTETSSVSGLPVYKIGFLIVHEAREGCCIIFNWWTGGEMLESKVFFSTYQNPRLIKKSTHPGHLVCVWELEIIEHEKNAWIKHILSISKLPRPDAYLKDTLNS